MEDVKTEAEQTAVESSIDTQGAQDQSQEATAQAEPVDDLENKAVPYSRFREVNTELKGTRDTVEKLQARLEQLERGQAPQATQDPQVAQVKEQLKQLGFVSQDDIQRTLQQERENLKMEQRLVSLESQYDGKDGRPKFDRTAVVEYALSKGFADPEAAYEAMHRPAIIDWHIKQALAKSGGVKSEASDGSGSSQSAGTSDQDLREAAKQGDQAALRTLLKRITAKG